MDQDSAGGVTSHSASHVRRVPSIAASKTSPWRWNEDNQGGVDLTAGYLANGGIGPYQAAVSDQPPILTYQIHPT